MMLVTFDVVAAHGFSATGAVDVGGGDDVDGVLVLVRPGAARTAGGQAQPGRGEEGEGWEGLAP
jgi:hypothetical protein